jgi:PTS system nitrogen regulatory IIA component
MTVASPDDVLRSALFADGLEAADRFAAVERLVAEAIVRFGIPADMGEAIRAAVLERERSFPTGIGEGLAMPHGFVRDLAPLVLFARFPAGVPFDAPDRRPVRLCTLLVGPDSADGRRVHLGLLARLSNLFLEPRAAVALAAARDASEMRELVERALGIGSGVLRPRS